MPIFELTLNEWDIDISKTFMCLSANKTVLFKKFLNRSEKKKKLFNNWELVYRFWWQFCAVNQDHEEKKNIIQAPEFLSVVGKASSGSPSNFTDFLVSGGLTPSFVVAPWTAVNSASGLGSGGLRRPAGAASPDVTSWCSCAWSHSRISAAIWFASCEKFFQNHFCWKFPMQNISIFKL